MAWGRRKIDRVPFRQMFQPSATSVAQVRPTCGYFGPQNTGFNQMFHAPVQLPGGALPDSLVVPLYDNNSSERIEVRLSRIRCTGNGPCVEGVLAEALTTNAEPPGHTVRGSSLAGITWYNDNETDGSSQFGEISVDVSNTTDLMMGPILIRYTLQVSPSPATATFNDVPTTHWAFRFIEALAASGITAGCGGGNYCPESPLTRAEMAVYPATAPGLHDPDDATQRRTPHGRPGGWAGATPRTGGVWTSHGRTGGRAPHLPATMPPS